MDNRGVSEVFGYVLMFTVTLLAMSTVVVFGVGALEDVQSSASADSGEFAMQTVESDVHALYRGTATTRVTELSVEQASVQSGEQTTVRVEALVGGTTELDETRTFRPIVYRTDEAAIAYENTLVARTQEDGEVVVTESLVTASSDQTILPVVATEPVDENDSSRGTTSVRLRRNASESGVVEGSPVTVTVEVLTTPQRVDVWDRELSARFAGLAGPGCFQPSDTEVQCQFETDALVVTFVKVEYDF
jgi:hypothetical protein